MQLRSKEMDENQVVVAVENVGTRKRMNQYAIKK